MATWDLGLMMRYRGSIKSPSKVHQKSIKSPSKVYQVYQVYQKFIKSSAINPILQVFSRLIG